MLTTILMIIPLVLILFCTLCWIQIPSRQPWICIKVGAKSGANMNSTTVYKEPGFTHL